MQVEISCLQGGGAGATTLQVEILCVQRGDAGATSSQIVLYIASHKWGCRYDKCESATSSHRVRNPVMLNNISTIFVSFNHNSSRFYITVP